jgi:hypothetical protein
MTFTGHIENGRVVLDAVTGLPDGTPVVVTVVQAPEDVKDREIPTLYERLKPFVGAIDGMPPDLSENIDHYLYGHPKK